ncbi:hypothetical protein ACLMJK_004425 [Lecanora helva]
MASFVKPPPSPFEPPPLGYRIISSPLKTIAQALYSVILYFRGSPSTKPHPSSSIRLVCISDTHTQKPASLPPGDVLIHAGDLSNDGSVAEIQDQVNWLSSLPYKHILVVCGNHDSYFDPRSRRKDDINKEINWGKIHYLQHSGLELTLPDHGNRCLSFYGAPQIPRCGGDEFAFQYERDEDAWSGTVPRDTDVLVTHTPPRHHLDLPGGLGCEFLLKEVWQVKPKVHIVGHVHAGYGREYCYWDEAQRSFEMLCARGETGILRDVVSLHAWMNLFKLAAYGLLGMMWTKVWGGTNGESLIVNASLTYRSTGQLKNPPQVIDI